jgi:hypothetical protein
MRPESLDERRSFPKRVVSDPGDDLLNALEQDLVRIMGVTSARVVGDDSPREVHVVASAARPPKQVVRDVQSLAAARFGISIDHRIVSVVQMDEEAQSPAATDGAHDAEVDTGEDRRPALDRIVVASRGDTGWVRVGLRWPDGEVTEGAGAAGATRDARARGSVNAVHQALEPLLASRNIALDLEHLLISPMGSSDSVIVKLGWHENGNATTLVGSALIEDDVASATVRAMLQALNRKLR